MKKINYIHVTLHNRSIILIYIQRPMSRLSDSNPFLIQLFHINLNYLILSLITFFKNVK